MQTVGTIFIIQQLLAIFYQRTKSNSCIYM